MGKLALDGIRVVPGLVGNGGEERPEAVHGGSGMVANAVQGIEHGVFRELPVRVVDTGEDKALAAMQYLHAVQDGERLAG